MRRCLEKSPRRRFPSACGIVVALEEASPAVTSGARLGVTEIAEIPNRGHALTVDSGWREVADKALAFVQRFVR